MSYCDDGNKKYFYLMPEVISKLDDDALRFEFFKNNKNEINRNGFLSRLIVGYYEEFAQYEDHIKNEIYSVLNSMQLSKAEKDLIVESIIKKVMMPKVKTWSDKKKKRIALKLTNECRSTVESIIYCNNEEYISTYFGRMIASYSELPMSKREQILFKSNYDCLVKACKSGNKVTFKVQRKNTGIHEVIPYKVVVGKDEMFNYLLCSEIDRRTGEQIPMTYRLCRLHEVEREYDRATIDNCIRTQLDKMIKSGPQFIINNETDIIVKLSKKGVDMFTRIHYGRPYVVCREEKDGNHYYHFNCSANQIAIYFERFGEEAEVINPPELRHEVLEFYRSAYYKYSGNNDNDLKEGSL